LDRQKVREEIATAEGARLFRERLEQAEKQGAGSTAGAARRLLLSGIRDVETAICAASTRKNRTSVKWWTLVGPDVAAYLTLRAVLDSTVGGHPVPLTRVAENLADSILDEVKYRRLKTHAPALFRYTLAHASTRNHAKRLREASRLAQVAVEDLRLPKSATILLGIQTIDCLLSATGWFECGYQFFTHKRKNRKQTVIVLRPDIRQKLSEDNELLGLLQPVLNPMIVPPLPWAPGVRGGFRFALKGRHNLVRRASKAQRQLIGRAAMPVVYEAVNRIQETGWRINTPVLDFVTELLTLGGGYAGIPKVSNTPLPDKPHDFESNDEVRKAWLIEAGAVRAANRLRVADAHKVSRVLAVAHGLRQEAVIYFPHNLDFRGRCYPLSSYLSPQGDDLSRALLTFAEGRPLDASGVRWLAIHGATMRGMTDDGRKVSRMTLGDRVRWVTDNETRVRSVAADPFATALWWNRSDKPLQFLAWCFEWESYVQARERGELFTSSLPCGMDGTCNGLQHFSALLRDEVGAAAVNVLPQEHPQDIYESVAKAVVNGLTAAAQTDPLASLWLTLHQRLGVINRTLCKQPTMTVAYGAKRYGFTTQLEQTLRDRDDFADLRAHFIIDGVSVFWPALRYLALQVWDCLCQTVPAAFTSMEWMTAAARGIAKRNRPVQWIVPASGFPVLQAYNIPKYGMVKTVLGGRAIYPAFKPPSDRIDTRKQAAAIAPNVVHSLDAAHLALTVVAAAAEGVSAFATVHDSFAAPAGSCETLARVLRESFVRLYTEADVLDSMHQQLRSQWLEPAACPPPPVKGALDMSKVQHSSYFFC
jgi:DNA-directed RNA polymerase